MRKLTVERLQEIVTIMSDGQFHSGEGLAKKIGTSRTAIWKLIKRLKDWQIKIYSVSGKGYKIPNGLSLLDAPFLQQQIATNAKLFDRVTVLSTVDSTSSYLARSWQVENKLGQICIAEHQTDGRGRKGNRWISPFGTNLYFSMGVDLPLGLTSLAGLSLAIGIGLTQLFNQYTTEPVKLKWPNDLLLNGKKLAGILVEASQGRAGGTFLNIGIGINWDMAQETNAIDQPWISLKPFLQGEGNRNKVLALSLLKVDEVLTEYMNNGFEFFRDEWPRYSAFIGEQVVVHGKRKKTLGVELGIEPNGALIIQTDDGEESFFSGDVSLRGA